jgi:hypothetical protein
MFANKKKGKSRLNIGGGGFAGNMGLLGGTSSFDAEGSEGEPSTNKAPPTRSTAGFMAASRDEFDDDF